MQQFLARRSHNPIVIIQSALFSSIVEIPSFLRINKCVIAHFIAYDATSKGAVNYINLAHEIIKKRRAFNNIRKKKDSEIMKGMFRSSIVLKYYILRIKTYSGILSK